MRCFVRLVAWASVAYGLWWATRTDWTSVWQHNFACAVGGAIILWGVFGYVKTINGLGWFGEDDRG